MLKSIYFVTFYKYFMVYFVKYETGILQFGAV